ncbi:hypothetical protein ADIARSV_1424 [Arcticibacter svalbardensis MN12-7]|uniref:Uncharacterized protein n=1 Tax=Arcticibacter svalbardensis MN12-7 TaxID=1150600 RepID=R9GUQ4_9SPHI|nr:hypothetical protein ADIARSV_1424 [Arcticibacter svalbardensis MN12-7]
MNKNASIHVSILKFGVPVDNVFISYETGPEMLPAYKKNRVILV